jgi:hypothetical protein
MGVTGTTLLDFSGYKRNISLVSTPDWVVSGGKQSVYFDGTADGGSVPLNLNGLYQITTSIWFRWMQYGIDDDLLFEYSSNAFANSGFIIDPNTSGAIYLSLTGGGYNQNSIVRPTQGEWVHMSVWWDRLAGASPAVKVWINGKPVTVTSITAQAVTGTFTNDTLYIACRNNANLFGKVYIDDFRIDAGLLPETKIQTLALRRGIAYETVQRRSSKSTATSTSSRKYFFQFGDKFFGWGT